MTEIDQASDLLLTEEACRPGQSEGKCLVCNLVGRFTLGHCYHEHTPGPDHMAYTPFCHCLACCEARVAQRGPSKWLLLDVQRAKEHIAMEERVAKRKLHDQNSANAKSQLGPREFTLTYSTKWGWDDDEAKETMRQAVERLTRYYKHEIIDFHAVGEFGSDGRPHVHGWYHLAGGRKITDKNFQRAYPRWNPKRKLGKGFEGGHHETISRISDFAGYAEKHLEEAWLKVDITNADANPSA